MSVFTVLGAVIFKELVDNNNNNLFHKTQRNIYCIFINPYAGRIYNKNKNFRTIKVKINVKDTNHEGIHKSLFELPDRRVEIKKMR